jgi:phage-related protein
MAYDIGPRIGIEGEKEYREAINQIVLKQKTLGTEMDVVNSKYDKNDKSLEAVSARNEVYTKQIEAQKEKLELLKQGLQAATEKYGENDKVTQGWQQAVNKATAELNKMERQLSDNLAETQGAAKETKNLSGATEEATEKSRKFSDALKSVGETLGKGIVAAAQATATAIAAVGAAAVAAGKQIFDLTKSSGEYADELITTSVQTGVSTEALQEWGYAARFIDTEVDTITKSMARNIKSMDAARDAQIKWQKSIENQVAAGKISIEQADEMIETGQGFETAYTKLGVRVMNANGTLRDSQEVYYDVIDALGRLENETERDAIAMEIFGKSAQELNPLIKAGSAELKRLGQEAHDMGVVLDEEALGALGDFDDTMQRIDAQTEAIGRNLAVTFLPAVSSVMDGVQDVLGTISTSLKDGIQPEDIKTIGGVISEKLVEGISTISEYLPDIIETVTSMLTELVSITVDLMPTLLPALMDGATALLMGLIKSVTDNVQPLVDMAVDLVKKFTEFLIQALPELIKGAMEIVVALAEGIAKALPELIPAIVETVIMIVETLIDNVDMLIDAAIAIILGLADGLIAALPKLLEKAPDIILKFVAALVKNAPKLLEAAVQLVVKLAEGLINNISKITDVGRNIVEGLWNGIKNATKWIKDKIAGFVDDVVGGIKSFFGIRSPSTVMVGIGENLSAGLALGITDNAKLVKSAMSGLEAEIANTDLKAAMGKLNAELNYSPSVSNKPIVNVNVEVPVELDKKVITKSTSQTQYANNRMRSRALGVVPA